jgi:hypothetical protein
VSSMMYFDARNLSARSLGEANIVKLLQFEALKNAPNR